MTLSSCVPCLVGKCSNPSSWRLWRDVGLACITLSSVLGRGFGRKLPMHVSQQPVGIHRNLSAVLRSGAWLLGTCESIGFFPLPPGPFLLLASLALLLPKDHLHPLFFTRRPLVHWPGVLRERSLSPSHSPVDYRECRARIGFSVHTEFDWIQARRNRPTPCRAHLCASLRQYEHLPPLIQQRCLRTWP